MIIISYKKAGKKWIIGYIVWWIGIILIIISIFTPWWAFNSGVAGEDGYLKLKITPFGGPSVDTPLGSLMDYLAPELKIVSILIMLPVLVPLIFGILYGVYSGIRRRVSKKIFIAPLWTVVSLINWMLYYYSVSFVLSMVGFDIPPTGSYDFTFEEYELVNASWGWGVGMYLSIISIAVMFVGGYIIRYYKIPKRDDLSKKMEMSAHSVLLILIGIGSILFGVVLFVLGAGLFNTPNYGGLFPITGGIVIFIMAYVGRGEYFVCPVCENPVKIDNIKDKYICKVCRLNLVTNEIEPEEDESKNVFERTYYKSKEIVERGVKKTQDTAREVKSDMDEFTAKQKQNYSQMRSKFEQGAYIPIPSKEKKENNKNSSEKNDPPPSPSGEEDPGKPCPVCATPMRYIHQYGRWWCDDCKKYK